MPAHADTWRHSEWWLSKLHVIQAWQSGAGAGAGVTVAVLADGVAAGQADLTGQVIAGPDFTRIEPARWQQVLRNHRYRPGQPDRRTWPRQ